MCDYFLSFCPLPVFCTHGAVSVRTYDVGFGFWIWLGVFCFLFLSSVCVSLAGARLEGSVSLEERKGTVDGRMNGVLCVSLKMNEKQKTKTMKIYIMMASTDDGWMTGWRKGEWCWFLSFFLSFFLF